MQLTTLLDRAKERTGSDQLTAKALKVTAQRLSDYRHGREPCPWKKQAQLCQVAELSAGEAWDHMREVAGAVARKTATATSALALLFVGSLAGGAVLSAARDGLRSATMYKPRTTKQLSTAAT